MRGAIERAEAMLRSTCADRVRARFPLASLTSFRIGGPAALYLEPENESDLLAAAEAISETEIAYVVLGKGSNMLVSDEGFEGLVIRLGKGFRWTARNGDRLNAGAAIPLPALSGVALAHALGGLEFGVAIPASLGGAVWMNAGAHGSDMAQVLESIEVFELGPALVRSIPANQAGFGYRSSTFPDGSVVVGATVRLQPGEKDRIRGLMDEARDWRRRTQPLAESSCGSVFKNPAGEHAARLIDDAGLKGLAVGGASVSVKHANFIVTSAGARAVDVVELIRKVQELVAARSDVHLEPEVHLVGHFDLATR